MNSGLESPVPSAERAPPSVPAAEAASAGEAWADREVQPPIGRWTRLCRSDSAQHALALVDQAVVSGTSFLTTVILGRSCGANELGVYALGFSLLVSWSTVQNALIALPYTIYRHRPQRSSAREYAGSALVHSGLLSVLAFILLGAVATVVSARSTWAGLTAVSWALAGVTPFVLLREFGRRFAFAHMRMAQALVLDLAVAAVQLSGLAWFATMDRLSAGTAYAAMAGACALSGAAWLYLERGAFAISWPRVWQTLAQSWALGRWLFASQLTVWVQAYFIHWLLAGLVGPTATGVYAACMTVVMFSNPVFLGISNALAPRAAQAYAEGGGPQLRRVILQTTLLLGAAMALFCGVALFAGEEILGLLYRGGQYAGYGNTVGVLAVAMLATALGMPASNGLAAAERPDLTFRAALLAVGLSVALVPGLVLRWGVGGAAYGFLAGNLVGSLARWASFLTLLRRREAEKPQSALATVGRDTAMLLSDVRRVLQEFTKDSDVRAWQIEPLSEGVQANLFTVRRRDGQPLHPRAHTVAVKLYKSAGRAGSMLARQQFEALTQLEAKLHGRTIQGWKISTPAPLHRSEEPLALVMTLVPGKSLNALLASADAATLATLEASAQGIAAALERYWLVDGALHGDLNFDNILCDPASRTLAFLDAGVVDPALLCEGVARQWYPASRDLAYLLFDTNVSLKKLLGNPAVQHRQQWLLERVLRAFLKRIGSAGAQQSLLDEIQACVQVQLRRLELSCSPRGVWRLFLRWTARRRICRLLSRLHVDRGDFGGGGCS